MLPSKLLHLLFLGSLFLQSTQASQPEEERLIGWKGESFNSSDPGEHAIKAPTVGKPWIETISWSPRAFVHHNFLTKAECDHIVHVASQRISRSQVVDAKTGQTKLDEIRTSYGATFGRAEDLVIAALEERIAEWTHIPPEHGEPLQVLRYMDGQQYGAHWDWFDDPKTHSAYLRDGNRYATVLLYLSEVEEGGETALPLGVAIDMGVQALLNPSPCATKGTGLAVRPRKGDALLFFDLDISGSAGDRAALHASCPTLKGTKWTATKWIHSKQYGGRFDVTKMMTCTDKATNCADLAAQGKCDSEDEDMIGMDGKCRKTCEDCIECPAGDIMCSRANMKGRRVRKYVYPI